jgi:hypothetical protein
MLTEILEIQEDNIWYYSIPENFSLFKGTRRYDVGQKRLDLRPEGFYFFGLKYDDPDSIESYEENYGVIFEFVTTRPYKLFALDKKETQDYLYKNAPAEIKTILEKNYGYKNGLRDSVSGPDRILSKYICDLGYEGYGIKNMSTETSENFQPEFMFCNIDGIKNVKKVTTDERASQILNLEKDKALSDDLKEQRKNKRKLQENNQVNMSPIKSGPFPGRLNFGDDDDDDEDPKTRGGTKNKRNYRKRKSHKKMKKHFNSNDKTKKNRTHKNRSRRRH